MPRRIASVKKKIAANGQALHRAMERRKGSAAADQGPSDSEAALLEERKLLKEERAKRKELALQPRPSALDRLVRTHHAQAKAAPKPRKEAGDAHDAKKPKARRTRAEKHAEKDAAVAAARNSHKSAAAKKPATK